MYTGHRFFSGLADGQRVGSSTFYGLCGLGFMFRVYDWIPIQKSSDEI